MLQDEGRLWERWRRAPPRPPSGRRTPADRRSSHNRQGARRFFASVGSRARSGAGGEPILRVLVPLQLHAQSAHAGIFGQPVELRPHVRGQKVGIADDRLAEIRSRRRPAGRRRLRPRSGLSPNWPAHRRIAVTPQAGEVGEIFADQIVAPDRLVGAEDARLHRPVEPRQVGAPPDVVMSVDDGGHAAALSLAKSRTCAQILSIDPPSPSSSR